MPKHILVTGAQGQLGSELQKLVNAREDKFEAYTFYFTDKENLDITDKEAVETYTTVHEIDTIINCAAYTAVDKAEEEQEMAMRVNRDAVKNLATVAKENDIFLIHISTDYVFDGSSHLPFIEEDSTNPQGVYGLSKLAGEEEILNISPSHALIIRASWVYNDNGYNFVNTMLELGQSKESINVVCDQIGTPTYARDLAEVILHIVVEEKTNPTTSVEIYHYSNEGSCSWYDFAKAIFEIQNISCKVNPINSDAYPTRVKRPHYSVLNKEKIKQKYTLEIPYWRDSLEACLSHVSKQTKQYKIGIIGSGFIASGLAKLLTQHPEYTITAILTRSNVEKRDGFAQQGLLTNRLEDLIERSDLIVECSGDAIYATETIDKIVKADIPVVTMNSEFHVTTGSYFADKGLVTEAEGDQPGVEAILHEEALSMGFKPLAYVNIKGFLNENPTREDMEYWGGKSNLSLEMVTSFTDGTKVQIEQVLVANGLGAKLIQEGLMKIPDDDMLHGGTIFAEKAKELGAPVSDYVISAKLPAGVYLVVEHDEEQKDALRYYKLGKGPYYVIERTYHLCHLEIIKTIKRVLTGGGVLLNNSAHPQYSVAAITKHAIKSGDTMHKAIGSFDMRGSSVEIQKHRSHVPIGLLADATFVRDVEEGEIVTFEDVELPQTLALKLWKEIINNIA